MSSAKKKKRAKVKNNRGEGKTAVAISIPNELLELADRQAEKMGLSRSQYIRVLINNDAEGK